MAESDSDCEPPVEMSREEVQNLLYLLGKMRKANLRVRANEDPEIKACLRAAHELALPSKQAAHQSRVQARLAKRRHDEKILLNSGIRQMRLKPQAEVVPLLEQAPKEENDIEASSCSQQDSVNIRTGDDLLRLAFDRLEKSAGTEAATAMEKHVPKSDKPRPLPLTDDMPRVNMDMLNALNEDPVNLEDEIVENDENEIVTETVETERAANEPGTKKRVLFKSRNCYICKAPFHELHHFYDQMCPSCAAFNWEMRCLKADLKGMVALVTGGRVKIGFAVVVRLLECGATVILTTRFPHDCALRYAELPGFDQWRDRLHIVGLDLRDLAAVHRFVDSLKQGHVLSLPVMRLDILIHNAAQTVRKPTKFYSHLMPIEAAPLPETVAPCVHQIDPCVSWNDQGEVAHMATLALPVPVQEVDQKDLQITSASKRMALSDSVAGRPVHRSAYMSQVPVTLADKKDDEFGAFPRDELDRDRQQVDLRVSNSWIQRLEEIATVELLEVHLINCFAPYVMNKELVGLLAESAKRGIEMSADQTPKKVGAYIVNVSAMEGQFYRASKTVYHPHSNMAKAGLNMMTRTSARDFAARDVYMNAVDTGWITDENPLVRHSRRPMPPPLDDLDAAMRILAPVLNGVNDPRNRKYGLFLKDYKPTHW